MSRHPGALEESLADACETAAGNLFAGDIDETLQAGLERLLSYHQRLADGQSLSREQLLELVRHGLYFGLGWAAARRSLWKDSGERYYNEWDQP